MSVQHIELRIDVPGLARDASSAPTSHRDCQPTRHRPRYSPHRTPFNIRDSSGQINRSTVRAHPQDGQRLPRKRSIFPIADGASAGHMSTSRVSASRRARRSARASTGARSGQAHLKTCLTRLSGYRIVASRTPRALHPRSRAMACRRRRVRRLVTHWHRSCRPAPVGWHTFRNRRQVVSIANGLDVPPANPQYAPRVWPTSANSRLYTGFQ